jgi:hypothetical protein
MADPDAKFENHLGKVYIYDTTITNAVVNENGDVQFNFVAEYHPKTGKKFRAEHTGTCTLRGGHYGTIGSDGTISEQQIWIADGPNTVDKMLSHACVRAVEKVSATKPASRKQTGTKIEL